MLIDFSVSDVPSHSQSHLHPLILNSPYRPLNKTVRHKPKCVFISVLAYIYRKTIRHGIRRRIITSEWLGIKMWPKKRVRMSYPLV